MNRRAVIGWAGGAALGVSAAVAPAAAQPLAVQAQQTVGTSSESIAAGATQLRVLGDVGRGWRIDVEGAWGTRSRSGSDVFGTAYPYDDRVQIVDAFAEWTRPGGRGVRAVKAGRYRTPFGISSAGDHAYLGFLRPPLIRYGGYYALSSGYLEHGAAVNLGAPRASLEVSLGTPADVGTARRRGEVSLVTRAEVAHGTVVVGASYLDTTPDQPARFAHGRARFGGLDLRWMRGGVLLRGEWIAGRPFDGTATRGGYADLVVHRPGLGPVTLLARAERLAYDARAPFALYTHRYTAAARVRLWSTLALAAGLTHQAGQSTQRRPTAIDVGLTYAVRQSLRP
ncbi:MAG: hypothetical protein AB7U83_17815 [Vicinamibacterales bacterium]